jgi:hypothetical protein
LARASASPFQVTRAKPRRNIPTSAASRLAYHEKYLDNEELPADQEKKLLAALIAISSGATDVAKLGVPVEVGRRLLECYDDLANE